MAFDFEARFLEEPLKTFPGEKPQMGAVENPAVLIAPFIPEKQIRHHGDMPYIRDANNQSTILLEVPQVRLKSLLHVVKKPC